jgi:signal transduction histidine kinase
VTSTSTRAVIGPRSLQRLRWRLTAWYAGTFLIILLLLGAGLFATITHLFDRDLDVSLRAAARQLAAVVQARGVRPGSAALTLPGRELFVFDSAGHSMDGKNAEPWLAAFAARASTATGATISHDAGSGRVLRAYAEPFTTANGLRLTAAAVADEVEVEDRYSGLIGSFAAAAVVAVLLVALGGWTVARQSTVPVEHAFDHMRRFVADAAHELRTPLTVVRSRAEVALRRERPSEEYRDALKSIEAESARIGRIVEDLLILARADAGERPIERARVFLDDVTLDAADAARVIADRRAVHVIVEDFEEAAVQGDAALLRQLVLIVLDNAVKYTPSGGTVRVGVRCIGACPELVVADTGIGIAPEHLERIFERFYRVDASRARETNTSSDGAGLGLSIARWIADEHGARIAIDSAPGRGTRIAVQFPPADAGVLSSS